MITHQSSTITNLNDIHSKFVGGQRLIFTLSFVCVGVSAFSCEEDKVEMGRLSLLVLTALVGAVLACQPPDCDTPDCGSCGEEHVVSHSQL